jgi:transposase
MVVIAWHMLTKQEDYAFTRPSLVREKLRRLELLTGTGRKRDEKGPPTPIYASRTNATSTSPARPNAPTDVSSATGSQP